MLWYVVFVALFVTVPVIAVPSDSSNVVRAASTDTSTVVRRQKNPTVCKYSSFNVIPIPCCTLIIQHSIQHVAQSIINNHFSLVFLLHASTCTGSSSRRYIQRYASTATSVNGARLSHVCYWSCSLLDQVLSLFVRILPMVGLSSVPGTIWLPVFVKCHWSLCIIAVFLLMLKSSVKFLRSDFGGISCRRRNTSLFMRMFLLTFLGMLGDFVLGIAFVDCEGCHHTWSVLQAVLVGSAGFECG